jgi:hypothetical protein
VSDKVYSFKDTAKVGKWAVEVIKQFLEQEGKQVEDVQDCKEWQPLDVDLLVNGQRVEVKGDRYRNTGNLYIETEYNGKPGCMLFTKSDYLVYYFVNDGRALLIPTKPLQDWVADNVHKYPSHSPRTPSGNKLVGSLGYRVKEADIKAGVEGIIDIDYLPIMEVK